MTEADQALTENGWVIYAESESGHSYLTLIEEEPYYVELDADEVYREYWLWFMRHAVKLSKKEGEQ